MKKILIFFLFLTSCVANQSEVNNNLLFNPCIHIHAQVKVLAVQQSRNQGRDVYEQVAHAVGIHINNVCSDCTFHEFVFAKSDHFQDIHSCKYMWF